MQTNHQIIFTDSRSLKALSDNSIALVVTSPPYPMIEMWDSIFTTLNPQIDNQLTNESGLTSFELMHQELDKVWAEIHRVLIPGGIVCINIGDATRTIGQSFQLYSNHSRILSFLVQQGFQVLPEILWRKPTNAPTKFMGSGMLPPGAYVTLEHEYILIARKGGKRLFPTSAEKELRRESAFFWEERNLWFSDLWDFKGSSQSLPNSQTRDRSAAFPFELAYRLINMFSIKGDTVLDPFLGTGTTMIAAMASARHSIGYEVDPGLKDQIFFKIRNVQTEANARIQQRLTEHQAFVEACQEKKRFLKYQNYYYQFPVMTSQEQFLFFNPLQNVEKRNDSSFIVTYQPTAVVDPAFVRPPQSSKNISKDKLLDYL